MSVFRFKRFSIQQDRCAMKVGTDGVLLGAWAGVDSADSALDIGAGTGLLSLMMAQRNPELQIHAIEIDKEASQQCFENFQASPWGARLQTECISFQDFINTTAKKWDLVVCNPPYFQTGMLSASQARNTARHASSLSAQDLFGLIPSIANAGCRFSLIIPFAIESHYCRIANGYGWNLKRKTNVITAIGKEPQRVLMEFVLNPVYEVTADSIVIEIGGRNIWSEEYKNLTREFHPTL